MLFNVTFSEISPDFLYKIVPASLTRGPLPCLNSLHHTYHHHGELHSLVCVLLFPLRRWAPLDQQLSSVCCSITNV